LNWLIKALSSSIGKKFVMALTGLLLCGFLVVHLAGNLLLYAGPSAYNGYAHKLHSQEWLIKIAEGGLVVLFGTHILLALRTAAENRRSRRNSYQAKVSKLDAVETVFGAPFSAETWMLVQPSSCSAFRWYLSDFAAGLRLRGSRQAVRRRFEF
jgi:succinate dehydrogenase / fumarate reductase cytochrome b subunit